ncbi:hydroxyisourate hydrolase [Mucilaginibacter paludis]|uniref:5-hydroxyisourate hydrolase n=1 Tax=Mucilaginibacter paludis DSM 18603 TaxID=714943 RepID=H1Y7X1_9SPHI|nr:hydroxyisourate hydrolase [Mucilaginibacter paludis]EHQ30457.1 hydroxyisourate hydrolase [Mucilaginibacter paludis DSM 18603]
MSQITTHILDTTLGKPAQGVAISLHQQHGAEWIKLAEGTTNADGRIANLLDKETVLPIGIYKMHFEVHPYFETLGITAFYPWVDIVFNISTNEHYHVPLLLNPFGYSTYRGS